MLIALLSIPHTGTHFVRDRLLRPAGIDYIDRHIWPDPGRYESLRHRVEEYKRAGAIITPIRHPLAVAKSWKRRGRPINELAQWWRQLVKQIDPLGPYYLPLDSKLRDAALDKINRDLALNLDPLDWPVLRDPTREYPPADLTDQERSLVLSEHYDPAFFGRWYEDTT